MPGSAISSKFMLGAATVMLGAKNTHWDLTPDNSIGLVKNFTLSSEPNYVQLTQGVKNTIVDSAINANPVKCTMELYEATGKNIKYALGLDGSGYTTDETAAIALSANVADAATTFKVATDLTGSGTGKFTVGKWVQLVQGGDDDVHYGKVTAATYSSPDTTVTIANHAFPKAFTMAAGAAATFVNYIDVGAVEDQPYLAAKVVGKLSDNTLIGVVIPKLRVIKGFNLGFVSDNYANLPMEFTPYELTAAERTTAALGGTSGVAEIFMP